VNPNLETFPEKQRLWEGAVLGSIVHAIMTARYPELSHEQSWDGMNYNIQDSMGSKGTVSFSEERLVGAFFDAHSNRNPFHTGGSYDLNHALQKLPPEHRRLAEAEALQYLLQEYNGEATPIVTAVFWSAGVRLTAAEPWQQVYEHGAHLIRIQLLETSVALQEWQRTYSMSPRQLELATTLFKAKRQSFKTPITLDADALGIIQADAAGPEGIDASRESFAELGIALP
jgi:hypothetical protein